jgi:hypothetical protein
MMNAHVNAVCSSPCNTDMDMRHEHGHAAPQKWVAACT